MLQITLPAEEMWDEVNEVFVYAKEQKLKLEHSLVSVSKWESKWGKSYFSCKVKSIEESLDYIRCMLLTPNIDENFVYRLSADDISKINKYIEAPMTATTIKDNRPKKNNGEILTSEVIYYEMIALNIPFECQKWHLNRLLTLIKICDIKNSPPNKMSEKAILRRNSELNAARKKKYNTKG